MELQFLTKSHEECAFWVRGAIEAVEAAQKDCQRHLLSGEKTTGKIADALRTLDNNHGAITEMCRLSETMLAEMAQIKDDCQAYTLGVEAGVRMVLDMLTRERHATLMREGKEANFLARWIELFHARVRQDHGITTEEK